MNQKARLLEDSLLLIWNNRNSVERLDLMKKIYDPEIKFFENNDSDAYVGFNAINILIEKLQFNWAENFEFKLLESDANHHIQHVSWSLGSAGQQAVAKGKDIAVTENGKIKSLYLFLD